MKKMQKKYAKVNTKHVIQSSINLDRIKDSTWNTIFKYFVDNDLGDKFNLYGFPTQFDNHRYRWYEFAEEQRTAISLLVPFLESKGIDSNTKINNLAYLIRSKHDVIPLLEHGFVGTASELKFMGADTRKLKDEQEREELESTYAEYWDDTDNAYVFPTGPNTEFTYDTGRSKARKLTWWLESYFYNPPVFGMKYNTKDKCWRVYVYWNN